MFSHDCQAWLFAMTRLLLNSRASTSSISTSLLCSLWNGSSLYFSIRGKFSAMYTPSAAPSMSFGAIASMVPETEYIAVRLSSSIALAWV